MNFRDIPLGKSIPADKPQIVKNNPTFAGVVDHGLATASYKEYLAHLSDLYNINYRFEDVASAAQVQFLISVEKTAVLSVDLKFDTEGYWRVDIHEGATVATLGTAVGAYNVNRRDTS
ncbi:MAG: hypothetical protein ACTSPI_17000, partial [Candidatus Heimdallarchaeaceae archaeon]